VGDFVAAPDEAVVEVGAAVAGERHAVDVEGGQVVVAGVAADDGVAAGADGDGVVAGCATDEVVAAAAVDGVVAVATDDRVVTIGAVDDRRAVLARGV